MLHAKQQHYQHMTKLLYVHGYNGSPYGSSYHHLKEACGNTYELHTIDYAPTQPKEAIRTIRQYVQEHGINVVIGASLGGFLTLQLSGLTRVVVNPCWDPAVELPKVGYTGPINEYVDILSSFLKTHNDEDRHLCTGCFADGDELLGTQYKAIFAKYFDKVYSISDGHKITAQSAVEIINVHLPETLHDKIVEFEPKQK